MEAVVIRGQLFGNALRSVVCLMLKDAGRPMNVAEIVSAVEARGFTIQGRPSKTVSDALRFELRRGRLWQLRRGVYAFKAMPRTTEQSMRQRVAFLQRALTSDRSLDERLDLFLASGRARSSLVY